MALEDLREVRFGDEARSRAPGLSADLATVLLKALETDPLRRYVSAGALGADLANWLAQVHPDDIDALKEQFARCLEDGGPRTMEYRRRSKSGEWIWMEAVGEVVKRDSAHRPLRMIGIHTDITERKKSLTEQKRLNRALRLVSECNLALVRNDDEIQLLNDICQLIVSTGGYLMAWVGYAEDDPAKTVRPAIPRRALTAS